MLFSVSGALILALQALRSVMPGFPVIEASAVASVGSAAAARILRAKYKIAAK